jgi:hypothetical protein
MFSRAFDQWITDFLEKSLQTQVISHRTTTSPSRASRHERKLYCDEIMAYTRDSLHGSIYPCDVSIGLDHAMNMG